MLRDVEEGTLRCGKCGNENAEGYRFCGMCGAPLTAGAPPAQPGSSVSRGSLNTPGAGASSANAASLSTPKPSTASMQPIAAPPGNPVGVQPDRRWATASSAIAGGAASARTEPAGTQRRWHDEGESEPVISGPSFLGLNQPGPRRSESDLDEDGRDPLDRLRTSRSVDYLLNDDEPPRRGWGKLVLILVALVLAGGFGYLRWKQGGFDWLTAGEKKPAAAQTAPDAAGGADSGNAAGAAPSAATAPPGGVAGNAAAGAAPAGTAPATNPTAANPTDAGASQPTTSQSNSSQRAAPTPAAGKSDNGTTQNSPTAAGNSQPPDGTQKAASDSGATASAEPASKTSDADNSDDEEQPAPAKPVPSKPVVVKRALPKPSPARPVDNVAEAQRYIYGRGAAQDCDRGLGMLKTAAGQSDAKAMILLGSSYSSGTCAPRALPTAYRWFAVALHKEPDNQALQNDLQKLWSQMTQPERQLAIRLSQ